VFHCFVNSDCILQNELQIYGKKFDLYPITVKMFVYPNKKTIFASINFNAIIEL